MQSNKNAQELIDECRKSDAPSYQGKVILLTKSISINIKNLPNTLPISQLKQIHNQLLNRNSGREVSTEGHKSNPNALPHQYHKQRRKLVLDKPMADEILTSFYFPSPLPEISFKFNYIIPKKPTAEQVVEEVINDKGK